MKAVERWYAEMPREEEMLPKDKYSIYDRKEKTYRKGIHSKFLPSENVAEKKQLWESMVSNICLLQNCPSGRGSVNVSTLLVSKLRPHRNYFRLCISIAYHTDCLPKLWQGGSNTQVFWTVRRTSIAIVLKHPTVYYWL